MKQVKSHYHHDLVNTFTGFDEYLEWRIKEDLHLQSEYLQDTNGDYLVDYVGRLENLQEDIQFIGKRLGMADFEIPHLNKRLKNGDYKNYYTAKTKRLVAEAFVEDIERFGYSFDRHSSDPIITH
jgi:hypothetical protein